MPTAAGLYYFAHGAENVTRPPVVLIHGAGGSHLSWPPQVRRLHDERIFAVDLPGHGKSAGVGHHGVADYAAGILDFLAALKLNQAVLVGHSLGGAVALQTAIDSPKRILALCLLGSAARLRVNPTLLQAASDPSKAADAASMLVEYSFAAGTSARTRELVEKRMLETRSSVLYGDLLACDAFDVSRQAIKVAAPTLIVFGAHDKMVSRQAGKALQEQIQGAQLEVVPEAGHMLMLEQPDRVAEVLGRFLKGIPYHPGK